jgi:hypothetical protein
MGPDDLRHPALPGITSPSTLVSVELREADDDRDQFSSWS